MYRWLAILLFCLVANVFFAALANERSESIESPSAEEALAFFQATEQAQLRLLRYAVSLGVDLEKGPSSEQQEQLAREAELVFNRFDGADFDALAGALMAADQSAVLERAMSDLSAASLAEVLRWATWGDISLTRHQEALLVGLLDDDRHPLSSGSPEFQQAMHAIPKSSALAFHGEADTVAEMVWPSVFQLLSPESRGEVAVMAISGQGYESIARALRRYLDVGVFTDTEIAVDIDWLLERVVEDRETWLPLLSSVAGEEEWAQLQEHVLSAPEAQQIRVLANRSDEVDLAQLLYLGEWMLDQSEAGLDDRLAYVLTDLLLKHPSQDSQRWLEQHFFQLPHVEELADEILLTLRWGSGDRTVSEPFLLQLLAHSSRLNLGPQQLIALHHYDPDALEQQLERLIDLQAADDSQSSIRCEQLKAYGYRLATDAAYQVPDSALDGFNHGWCSTKLIELADGLGSVELLDWLIDSLGEKVEVDDLTSLAWRFSAMEDDSLREHVVWRLRSSDAWELLSPENQQRLQDPEGFRAQRQAACQQELDDSDLESVVF